jgi:cytochrome c oxidase subunit 2
MPEPASNISGIVDTAFQGYALVAAVLFILLASFTLIFTFLYLKRTAHQRAAEQVPENSILEVVLLLAALIVCSSLFAFGIKDYMDLRIAPNNAIEVQVAAEGGRWSFTYPEGAKVDSLIVPVGQPVKLVMNAKEAIRSFFIPSFRVRKDAIPGRYTTVWFTPNRRGTFPLICTKYGTGEHEPVPDVKAVDYGDYLGWVIEASSPAKELTPLEFGEFLYKKHVCITCHSVDGTKLVAPTMKDLFGSERSLQSGESVPADEDYIKRSFTDPKAEVSAGYDPVMAAYKLTDEETEALMLFIKSLAGIDQE